MRKVCECNCPALPPNKGGYFRQVKSMFYGPSSSSSCYFYHRFSPQSTFELQALDSGIYVARTAHTSIFRKPIKIAPARGGSPNFEIHFFFLCISINLNQLSFFSDFFFFFCEMQLAIVPARLSELSGCCLLHSSVLNTYSKLYNYALTEKDEHSCSFHYGGPLPRDL